MELNYGAICRMPRFNRLTPNDPYMGRTAPLTSKRCILYIYSTNIGTEYFKHALYSPFFFSLSSKCSLFHNANLFGSYIIHILYTGVVKLKKKNNNSGAKGLTPPHMRWRTKLHIESKAGWAPEEVTTTWRRDIFLNHAEIRTVDRLVREVVAVATALT